jgi:hypothetical protein
MNFRLLLEVTEKDNEEKKKDGNNRSQIAAIA